MNGWIYLTLGVMLILWPGAVQTLFRDRPYVGSEAGLVRALGLAVVVIGWLYRFGGRSGSREVAAASVIDRWIFVPLVALPLAYAGVFPHLMVSFTVLDVALATGAWAILRAQPAPPAVSSARTS
jgi:hypothetical protein